MKFYVLIESCCNHFAGLYTEEEFKNFEWRFEDDKHDHHWRVYELKDGKLDILEFYKNTVSIEENV